MPKKDPSEREEKELKDIIDDLEFIFKKEKISHTEIDDLKSELKSKEVFSYLNALRNGAKPEVALREELLAGKRSNTPTQVFESSHEVASEGTSQKCDGGG